MKDDIAIVMVCNMWQPAVFTQTGNHVHPCPVCYRHVPCGEPCTIEIDLQLSDGTDSGGHDVCAHCTAWQRSHDAVLWGSGDAREAGW